MYDGYENRVTWAFCMWINNNPHALNMWRDTAQNNINNGHKNDLDKWAGILEHWYRGRAYAYAQEVDQFIFVHTSRKENINWKEVAQDVLSNLI